MTSGNSFLGVGWAFPPEFNKGTNSVKIVSESHDIQESLNILLSTFPGERVMQPTYGCELRTMVFETINESTVTALKDIIERAILFFEPRITLDEIHLETNAIEDGLLTIVLEYTVRATNTRSNMVYPFYFNEGTGILS
jgi:phage baseplate assembly protein W